MNVAEVILFDIPVFSSSAQCPMVSTWCIVKSERRKVGMKGEESY